MHGSTRTFTGARANGAPFYLMAGIGFDAETVRRLDLDAKRRWGKPAYTRPVLSALPPVSRGCSHRRWRARSRSALGSRRQCPPLRRSFKLSDKAGLHRPNLLVYLVPRGGLIRRLAHLTALGLGSLEKMPGVTL